MSWRERFGGGDERAEVAARARALLGTAGVTTRAAPVFPGGGRWSVPPVDPSAPAVPTLRPVLASTVSSAAVAPAVLPVAPVPVAPVPVEPVPVEPVPVEPVPVASGPPVTSPSGSRGGWVPGQPVTAARFAATVSPPPARHAKPGDPAGPASGVDVGAGVGSGLDADSDADSDADAAADLRVAVDGTHGLDLPDPADDSRVRYVRNRPDTDWSPLLTPVAPVVPWRERIRFDPGRRGLVAVAAVVVLVALVAGGVLFRGGQSSAVTVAPATGLSGASAAPVEGGTAGATAAPDVAAGSSGSGSAAPAGSSATGTVTVDVAGLVARPGVYTLPAGSRVEDALTAAGGPLPGADLTAVNRARVLVDGEQLAVAVPGAAAPAAAGSAATGSTNGGTGAGGLVDLNTAGPADLDTLPGVGPVLAQAILDWRTDHGRFSSVDDLQQVSGIGPSRFDTLKDLVTV